MKKNKNVSSFQCTHSIYKFIVKDSFIFESIRHLILIKDKNINDAFHHIYRKYDVR